jgi:hypothetical protein
MFPLTLDLPFSHQPLKEIKVKTVKFFVLALTLTLSGEAFAQSAQRLWRDIKLPNQKVIEMQSISNIIAAGTTQVLNLEQGPTSAAAASVSTFLAQPDVPRNLVITPSTSTVDVGTCTITVTGTDYLNRALTEDFAFSNNASSATTGNKAVKTVSLVSFAASCEDGSFAAKWNIGYGEKIGLKRCMSGNHLVFSTIDGAYETTRATVAYDEDEVSKNTADFNGTMNGSSDFEAFFIQNFNASCQP